jgi:inorganic pyrophosphatase
MNACDYIGQTLTIKIDRLLGSRHPQYNFVYSVNYGYLPGVLSPDGEELDAYVLGVLEPLEEFCGVCLAVIQRSNDEDDKLVVVPAGMNFSDDEIRAMTEFQERWFTSTIRR